ncbi:CpaF family protein, partial [bacterium AH-315-F18]|nr:CpaF family protein [bacterium AH-315-F18]
SRKVTHITEVLGMEGDVITLQNIYMFVQTGIGKDGKVQGAHKPTGVVPRICERLKKEGVEVDMGLFR